ncbi:MAG: hypothetical protein ACRDWG_18735 [Actinomycetes bacterium]
MLITERVPVPVVGNGRAAVLARKPARRAAVRTGVERAGAAGPIANAGARLVAGEVGSGRANQTGGHVMSDLAIEIVVAAAAFLAAVALWRIHRYRQQALGAEYFLNTLRSGHARPNPDRRRRA